MDDECYADGVPLLLPLLSPTAAPKNVTTMSIVNANIEHIHRNIPSALRVRDNFPPNFWSGCLRGRLRLFRGATAASLAEDAGEVGGLGWKPPVADAMRHTNVRSSDHSINRHSSIFPTTEDFGETSRGSRGLPQGYDATGTSRT